MPESQELEARMAQLEERYLWLQRHVTEQDKEMLALHEEVSRLKRELLNHREQLESLREPDVPDIDERPPHY